MGGHSSGRYRTRNRGAIESATTLDIRKLRSLGFIRPNTMASGPLYWRDQSGRELASINLTVTLGTASGEAVLRFATNGEARTQTIRIEGEPMRFGGHRFYFVCPLRHDRCERLAVVGGVFASRQAHRLVYRSQSEDRMGRLHRKAGKLRSRLDDPPPRNRPRGARKARLVEAWIEAEEARENAFAAEVLRRWGGWEGLTRALGDG